jgi:hypothetical protein
MSESTLPTKLPVTKQKAIKDDALAQVSRLKTPIQANAMHRPGTEGGTQG